MKYLKALIMAFVVGFACYYVTKDAGCTFLASLITTNEIVRA